MATLNEVRALKRKYAAELLRQPGVVGLDIDIKDSGEAELTVYLDTKDPKLRAALPEQLDGVTVKYAYSGPIRKLG